MAAISDRRAAQVIVGFLLLASLIPSGCNDSASTPQATAESAPEPPPQTDKLAILFHRGDGPFAEAIRDGISSAAEQFAQEIEFLPADEGDGAEQKTLLRKAIEERFRGICLFPIDASISESLAEAETAGIPVVTFGNELPPEVNVVSHASTDQFHAGRLVAEFLAKRLDDATVLVVDCQGDTRSATRAAGFEYAATKELENFTLHTVTCDEDLNAAIASSLEEHEATAIFATNAASTTAALEATSGEDAEEVLICGYGAGPGITEALGNETLACTLLEDPYMIGFLPVMAMANHLGGEDSVSELITTGEHLITADQLDDPTTIRLLDSNSP